MLSVAELRELLDYSADTGEFRWRIRPARSKVCAGQIAGATASGYRLIMVNRKNYRAHRLAWLFVYGEWPSDQIDHINRNKLDNRIANLRVATPQQNQFNRPITARNTSGFKGVAANRRTGRFRASINIDGKRTQIGMFDTAEEAAEAYIEASQRVHGDFSFVKSAAATALLDWS